MKLSKGNAAALLAVVVLASVIGWRMLASSDSEEAETVANMSTPPGLAELQQRAEDDPDNPEAWQELALAHYSLNQYAEAAQAYERAVALDPESALLWSALGDALAKASNVAAIPPRASEAFRRALEIDPVDPTARYFLAVEKDLAGDHEGAIADWLALLADTPPGARWEADLVRTIQQVGAINQIEVEDRIASAAGTRDLLPGNMANQRGPTQQQMAAAANLSPDQQQDMAETMVGNLAQRIDRQGGSVDEWIMLMRSYRQMGRTGEARRTRDRAVEAHPEARDQIMQIAEQLEIG
jgi:cytochrome c-type biogenesis protein CcmH